MGGTEAHAALLAKYDAMAHRVAAQVIGAYSTSFLLSSRLLSPRVRRDIANLYAVVRIADEIVDGVGEAAGVDDVQRQLDRFEAEVLHAPSQRFHPNPVLHAYGISARHCGWQASHLQAFFSSMRTDVNDAHRALSEAELARYVYGSAEVIGLLCLDAFLADSQARAGASTQRGGEERVLEPSPGFTEGISEDVIPRDSTPRGTSREDLERSARALGRAFQMVNFLRDLGEDEHVLGRHYLAQQALSPQRKREIERSVRADFEVAKQGINALPSSARRAVVVATALYEALLECCEVATPERLQAQRVRLPAWRKAQVVARALYGDIAAGREEDGTNKRGRLA